jgi:hypothetical protein
MVMSRGTMMEIETLVMVIVLAVILGFLLGIHVGFQWCINLLRLNKKEKFDTAIVEKEVR